VAAIHTVNNFQNIVFVHIPRTGGTSISDWFKHNCKSNNLKIWFDHPTIEDIKKRIEIDFSFTVVRNPWDRILSNYFHILSVISMAPRLIDTEFLFLDNYKKQKTLNIQQLMIEINSGYFTNPQLTFEQYINDYHFLTHPPGIAGTKNISLFVSQLYWIKNINQIDYIIKYENLEEEFKVIQDIFDIKNLLPKINTTTHKIYQEYYNDNTRNIISKIFEEEIDIFKYKF